MIIEERRCLLFSVIICTYNRCQYLKETLDSLILLTTGRTDVEIVIIDNNSSDNTRTIINEYIDNHTVNYFLETNQGLSHARNRGIKEANGDILVFLDDDIDLEKDYFIVLEKLFSDSTIQIVGGKVLPYKIAVPEWMPGKYYYLASIFDIGNRMIKVAKLMGANYAMRKEVASQVGWYDPELGRKGNKLLGGEEIDYLDRASKIGYAIWFIPELIVYHKINNKLTKEYILEYAYFLGKSEMNIDKKRSLLKLNIKLLKSIADIFLYRVLGFYYPIPKTQMTFNIKNRYALGYINEFRNATNKRILD